MAGFSPDRLLPALTFGLLCCAGAVELTPKNWDKKVANKTVFIKFYAPWCGHCKKLKPDWDRLMSDFKGSPIALVAEVDCTSKGKPLCEKYGVNGFPRLMWGKADAADAKLDVYNGARTYQELKEFADDYLGPSCSPGRLELCNERRRPLMEKFMSISPERLDVKVQAARRQLKKAEDIFMNQQFNFTAQIDIAETKKNEEIKAIKERLGLATGNAVKGTFELTPDNWDKKTKGKAVFIKFFAPWCGHCKKLKPDWDKLQANWEGTKTALVAEVDCTGKGKELCDRHSVTGYPRLMWAKAGDDLAIYSDPRTYTDMKMFADMILGDPCGPDNLDACEKKYRAIHAQAAQISADQREEKEKAAEKEIEEAERRFQDVEWNMSLAIDKAEQERNKRIKEIKDQGLSEALKVQKWNKLQPPGSWKSPASPRSGPLDLLHETVFEVSDIRFSFLSVASMLLAVASAVAMVRRANSKKQAGGKCCSARHILMKTQEEIAQAKARIDSGEDFGKVAADCSLCPSGKSSDGSLGIRAAGSMDPAIDRLCFDPATKLHEVVGPVQSKFGFHLLVIDSREGVGDVGDDGTGEGPAAADGSESRKHR